jgi:uncharacterized membrane protein
MPPRIQVTVARCSALLEGVPILRRLSYWLFALLLLTAAAAHFLRPEPFVLIVPPLVPWPLAAVYLSGAAEFVLGVALLIPRTSRLAALGVVFLLVAVFPANVYHWLGDVRVDGTAAPGWYHALRLPLQGLLIGWAYWLFRASPEPVPPMERAPRWAPGVSPGSPEQLRR